MVRCNRCLLFRCYCARDAMWRWCTTSRSVVKCSLLVWIFIRKYGAAVSIICFVLEGVSFESHRLCYCFHPTQAMGGRRSVLCVGVGVAGGWKLVFTVLCWTVPKAGASVAGEDGGGGPLHCAVGTRLTPLKSGATTPQILGSLPPFVDPSCLMPFIFLLELFMFRRGTM